MAALSHVLAALRSARLCSFAALRNFELVLRFPAAYGAFTVCCVNTCVASCVACAARWQCTLAPMERLPMPLA